MSNSNPPTVLTINVAGLCIAAFILFNRIMPEFQAIFDDLGTTVPLATQFILCSYRWIWLGAVLSVIIWSCVDRHMLSRSWSRAILFGIVIGVVIYVPSAIFAMYLPMLKVMDAIG